MSCIIGIDVGGSTTKIVGFRGDEKHIITPMSVKASDPVASVFGAFGKFTSVNSIKLSDISNVMMTGVGSTFFGKELFGIPTCHVSEFDSVGLGGLYLSDLTQAVVVSMGTGTALVKAKLSGEIKYLGGTGVGGGTLVGLSKKLLGISHVDNIVELAKSGKIENIDLRIADMTQKNIIPSLPPATTAANFGKVSDIATNEDIALGLINLVFESVGMLSVFAARQCGMKDIVMLGNLTTIPQASELFKKLSDMFSLNFRIPEYSQYGTVIGCALEYFKNPGTED